MDQALRESEARFRALSNLSSDWFWEIDATFRVTRIDSRRQRKAMAPADFIGKMPWEGGFGIEVEGGWDACRALLESRSQIRDLVMQRLLPDGRPYYVCANAEPMYDYHGRFAGYRGVSREITKQKIAEDHIQHLATHDDLTGLPNRVMFSQLADAAIKTARRYKRDFAVMFIDLDGFKSINDTLGHEAGDIFLKEIATRLEKTLRASDVIARLGGDEFVVLVRELGDPSQAEPVAAKLLSAAASPLTILGQRCHVTASIGIALFPQDGESEQLLMKNADGAMYCAKKAGKNMFRFHSDVARLL
jgi:diguanylate cyclase (GGDEF)-like protein